MSNNEHKNIAHYWAELQDKFKESYSGDISGRELIYRGVSSLEHKLHSSAYRRFLDSKIIKEPKTQQQQEEYDILTRDIMQANMEELIDQVRLNDWDRKEAGRSLKDLEILALLRHYGAAVSLMDWTWSFHIALWFACCDALKYDEKTCAALESGGKICDDPKYIGKIYFVDINDIGPDITYRDLEKDRFSFISESDSQAKPYYWEAASLTDRIPRQNSVFLLGKEPFSDDVFNKVIKIKAEDKKYILQELDALLSINAKSLFKDLFGFADNNKAGNKLESKYLSCLIQGIKFLSEGQFKEAIDAYTKAISCVHGSNIAFNNRGAAKREMGDFGDAIKDFTEAIRLNPKDAEVYYNRGFVKRQKGDLGGAIKDYNKAIHLKPKYAEAYNNRGIARSEQGDLDDAIEDYDEAIRLKPDFADAYNNRGITKGKMKDFDGAIKDFDKAIRLNPDDNVGYRNRGAVKLQKGDFKGAIEDFDQAIDLKPDDAEAFYNRGVAKGEMEDFDGAIEDYDQAIRLKPDFAEAFYNRGVAKGKRGVAKSKMDDIDGAMEDFGKARELAKQQGNQKLQDQVEAAKRWLEEARRQLKKQQDSDPSA